jgi:hypothetical protein
VPEHKQPGQGVYSDKDFADDAVTVQDRLETRGVFRNNAKLCFFREKPELYGVWRRVSALESPNASLHVHAFDRAWTVTMMPAHCRASDSAAVYSKQLRCLFVREGQDKTGQQGSRAAKEDSRGEQIGRTAQVDSRGEQIGRTTQEDSTGETYGKTARRCMSTPFRGCADSNGKHRKPLNDSPCH